MQIYFKKLTKLPLLVVITNFLAFFCFYFTIFPPWNWIRIRIQYADQGVKMYADPDPDPHPWYGTRKFHMIVFFLIQMSTGAVIDG